MTFKTLTNKILSDNVFQNKPPVLIDIGASGGYHKRWMTIAPHSICLAFDADDRKMGYVENENTIFKKQLVFNSLVYPEPQKEVTFYLTRSPQCSSTLEPDTPALLPWAWAGHFTVEKTVKLPAVTLPDVLQQAGLDYVDWFKTDSQGIDLSLFKSLPEPMRANVTVVETEPGIIDAYRGENKLYQILEYLGSTGFWLADIVIKGFPRTGQEVLNEYSNATLRRLFTLSQKPSPGWGEMLWLNTFEGKPDRRRLLLGWIVGTVEQQHGFALSLAKQGFALHQDPLFQELEQFSRRKMTANIFRLRFLYAAVTRLKNLF